MRRRAALLLVITFSVACGAPSRPAESTAAPPLVVPAARPSASTAAAPSSSVAPTPPDWRSVGIPEPTRPYTPDDYRRLVLGLGRLAQNGRGSLPRAAGPDMQLFAHWVSVQQLAPLDDRSVPPGDRSILAQGYLSQVPSAFQYYLPGTDGLDFSEEQVAWVEFLFQLESRALRLSTGTEAGSKRSEEVASRQIAMFVGTIEGTLKLLAERGQRSEAHRTRLAKALEGALRSLRLAELGDARTRLAERLTAAVRDETSTSVRAELERAKDAATGNGR
jgi:hypothetical protein